MKLFIAEKPNVAKAIAAELGVVGRSNGYSKCKGDSLVTWCFGHMLEQAEPDFYTPDEVPRAKNGRKIWRMEELPIIPEKWKIEPKKDAKDQLNIIKQLLKGLGDNDVVVNAGDPDREGQLLIDEILDFYNYKGKVERYWVSAVDSVSVKRGLQKLEDNAKYRTMGTAAKARSQADWLIGMNLSRLYTLLAKKSGSRSLLTVGRVQTPTLEIVAERDKAIENFKSKDFYNIHALCDYQNTVFAAKWQPKEQQEGLDEEGRLIDQDVAKKLVGRLTGAEATVTNAEIKNKKENQPLAFSLSDITDRANKKFGYSAAQILDICQALYETHKLTTYPRSDCSYLPESQFSDSEATLSAIKSNCPQLSKFIDGADIKIKSGVWNDAKITAHHGIIPTMQKADMAALSEAELNVYNEIAANYLAFFYPPRTYTTTVITMQALSETFISKGEVELEKGWRVIFPRSSNKEDEQKLPNLSKGNSIHLKDIGIAIGKTKPPARFTEGSLVRAMENIYKYVDVPEHKKLLKDGDGIGTSATRAKIINDLKARGFLVDKGKNIISSELGRSMLAALPNAVKSPVLTAIYERMLKDIETGQMEWRNFVEKQEEFIRKEILAANGRTVVLKGGVQGPEISKIHKCMSCGHGLIRMKGKKKGDYWWRCSNYPECDQTYRESKNPKMWGKPDYSTGYSKKANMKQEG